MATPSLKPALTAIPVRDNQALKNLDTNKSGKVTRSDLVGLSADQRDAVMTALSAMHLDFATTPPRKLDLEGKRVLFSGLKGLTQAEAARMATAVGASVKRRLSKSVDVLVVGDRNKTTVDEQAIRMVARGYASIALLTQEAFESLAARGTATVVKLGNDDGAGERTLVETTVYNGETGEEHKEAVSVRTSIVNAANAALRAYLREAFGDMAENWDNPADFQRAVDATEISGFLTPVDEDPLGHDLREVFVFTAGNEDVAGDNALYVAVNRATGEIESVESFN